MFSKPFLVTKIRLCSFFLLHSMYSLFIDKTEGLNNAFSGDKNPHKRTSDGRLITWWTIDLSNKLDKK